MLLQYVFRNHETPEHGGTSIFKKIFYVLDGNGEKQEKRIISFAGAHLKAKQKKRSISSIFTTFRTSFRVFKSLAR